LWLWNCDKGTGGQHLVQMLLDRSRADAEVGCSESRDVVRMIVK
jgi:hypothetical protein